MSSFKTFTCTASERAHTDRETTVIWQWMCRQQQKIMSDFTISHSFVVVVSIWQWSECDFILNQHTPKQKEFTEKINEIYRVTERKSHIVFVSVEYTSILM